ncbi:hypothetical protein DFH27DRAFT_550444 [Peziza echinospora]|nr:hypothetical protein DFH27DRAFT_550444 [Peziza echinospora]
MADYSSFPPSFQSQLIPTEAAPLTEANLPDQAGRVFIVTGGNTGVGGALVRILYQRNGTVYVASRSATKALAHIAALEAAYPESTGKLVFLRLVLNDLAAVRAAALEFAAKETRLDVLFNNAGVTTMPPEETTAQGHPIRMGTNVLGHFVLTHHLYPLLRATAAAAPPHSVRVTWTGSLVIDLTTSLDPAGVTFEEVVADDRAPGLPVVLRKYAMSKLGNWLLAAEFAKRRAAEAGIVSIALNPGSLDTGAWEDELKAGVTLFEPKYGAYVNLWAGLSEGITAQDGLDGKYAVPWGAWHPDPRADIVRAFKTKAEGGSGVAEKFYDWVAEQVKEFL